MQCGWRWDHPKLSKPIQRKELSGWHVSWFMQPEDLIIKLKSFAHNGEDWVTEILKDVNIIDSRFRDGKDVTGKFSIKKFNSSYPRYKNLIGYGFKK